MIKVISVEIPATAGFSQLSGTIIFAGSVKDCVMKKLLIIVLGCVALACGDGVRDNDNSNRSNDREAAADEDVDIGSGEAVSPQLELDSADNTFGVDTISSQEEAQERSDEDPR